MSYHQIGNDNQRKALVMQICHDSRTDRGCGGENRAHARFCRHCGLPLRFAPQFHDSGTEVGAYRIVRMMGYGAFGAVYEAQALAASSPRTVALKETYDPDSIRRFKEEWPILSRLQHLNLPAYLDIFEQAPLNWGDIRKGYLVMELVTGESLEELLKRERQGLPLARVLSIAAQLCDALSYLHSQTPPILHRDIKPVNIRFTSQGIVKLVDFGLVMRGGGITRSTRRTWAAEYAPLEQWGGGANVRRDIYSLAATLYHLFTGKAPLTATERISVPSDPLRPAHELNPKLALYLSDALMVGMALLSRNRYATAQALKDALIPKRDSSSHHANTVDDIVRVGKESTTAPKASAPFTVSPREVLQVGKSVHSLAFSPDGKLLLLGGEQGMVEFWQLRKRKKLRACVGHEARVFSVAYSPNGNLAASGSADKTIRVWDTAKGKEILSLTGHTDRVRAVAFSPNGQFLASASFDKTVRLWELPSGHERYRLSGHTNWVMSLAFSLNGEQLASGSLDKTIRLWNLSTGQQIQRLEGHGGYISSLLFIDERRMLSASADKSIRLWDIKSAQPIYHALRVQRFSGHTETIMSLALNLKQEILLSSSNDQSIRLWDMAQNWHIEPLQEHNNRVYSVVFAPNGEQFASGSADGTVRLWKITAL